MTSLKEIGGAFLKGTANVVSGAAKVTGKAAKGTVNVISTYPKLSITAAAVAVAYANGLPNLSSVALQNCNTVKTCTDQLFGYWSTCKVETICEPTVLGSVVEKVSSAASTVGTFLVDNQVATAITVGVSTATIAGRKYIASGVEAIKSALTRKKADVPPANEPSVNPPQQQEQQVEQ